MKMIEKMPYHQLGNEKEINREENTQAISVKHREKYANIDAADE